MKIDQTLFDAVSEEAKASPRLRMARDMRNSAADNSQRMLNAIEPGTELPVHRHRTSSETCIVLRGAAEELFYDDGGQLTERVVMRPDSECCGVNIAAGRWHKIVSLEPGTVIFESKDGAYAPLTAEDILSI